MGKLILLRLIQINGNLQAKPFQTPEKILYENKKYQKAKILRLVMWRRM